ncbi:MAG: tRNA epoxyqueuosine(34) reductase QueG [Planctomycetota bacterium]|jgi:epoxyqueuosine reductase
MSFEQDIKTKAIELGFDAAGITTAEPVDAAHVEYFQRWLADGCAAEMGYLHRNINKRFDPGKLLTGAKSVICVALNYRPDKVAQASCLSRKCPPLRIANFAQYEDYHPFIKDRLFKLAEFIGNAGVSPATKNTCDRDGRVPKFKACVDSVPIAERALAQRAGLGFIGKNRMLISPDLGSQTLLGVLITTLELQADEPFEQIPCGDCGKCIRACPTGALAHDGSFDARKCISYQTIESGSATVPVAYKSNCGRDARVPSYIFGCDECILACPHDLGKPERKNTDFQHHAEWQDLTPEQIQNMTEEEFQKTFAGSGFIRLGLDRLKRNAACIRQT